MLSAGACTGVRDLQFVDERECRYIFTAVENLGKLALKVADIGLEAITLPHFDGEGWWWFFLASRRSVLCEKHLGYILEVVERM